MTIDVKIRKNKVNLEGDLASYKSPINFSTTILDKNNDHASVRKLIDWKSQKLSVV